MSGTPEPPSIGGDVDGSARRRHWLDPERREREHSGRPGPNLLAGDYSLGEIRVSATVGQQSRTPPLTWTRPTRSSRAATASCGLFQRRHAQLQFIEPVVHQHEHRRIRPSITRAPALRDENARHVRHRGRRIWEDLQCDIAIEFDVPGSIDLAHTAGADQARPFHRRRAWCREQPPGREVGRPDSSGADGTGCLQRPSPISQRGWGRERPRVTRNRE